MDDTQGRIAVPHRVHDDAHREEVVYLIQGLVLVLHFLIDAEKMLDPAVYLGFDACVADVLADLVHDALDIFLPHVPAHGNLIHQVVIDIRLQIF